MRFRRGAKLDPSQVTDVRGRRAGPMAVGGGGVGLVVVLAIVLLNVLGGGGASSALELLEGQEIGTGQGSAELQQECRTGQDANERQDCRLVADINSIQAYWQESLDGYTPANTVFFTDSVQTGCGFADAAGRPVLLPAPTSASTSTSASTTSCSRASAPRAVRSPRRTCSRTSTATMSRT